MLVGGGMPAGRIGRQRCMARHSACARAAQRTPLCECHWDGRAVKSARGDRYHTIWYRRRVGGCHVRYRAHTLVRRSCTPPATAHAGVHGRDPAWRALRPIDMSSHRPPGRWPARSRGRPFRRRDAAYEGHNLRGHQDEPIEKNAIQWRGIATAVGRGQGTAGAAGPAPVEACRRWGLSPSGPNTRHDPPQPPPPEHGH